MTTSYGGWSGSIQLAIDWNDSISGSTFSYAPVISAQSSSYVSDPSTCRGWILQVDGSTVSSGGDDGGSYDGTGWQTIDTFGTRTVGMSYGTTHSIYLHYWCDDFYGASGKYVEVAATYTVPALSYSVPKTPTIGTNTRNGDTSNSITWSISYTSSTDQYPLDKVCIERSTNSGTWTQIATVSAGTTSYTDTSASANNYYSYRVRGYNSAGYGAYSGASNTTYNTPAAPTNATATVSSGTTINLTWTNTANTATASVVERSTDSGSTWSVISTISGSAVTDYTDTFGGIAIYRVKNTRDTLISAYATSNSVTSLCAPNPPTLLSPASSAVIPTSQNSVALTWRHNTIDSSAQTAATVAISTDGGSTFATKSVTTASAYTLDLSSYTINTVITWKVMTKGAADGYSAYSSVSSFRYRQSPTLSIVNPASDGTTVTTAPVTVGLSYTDNSGSLSSLSFTITDASGISVYSYKGTQSSITIPLSTWTPDNGVTYTINAMASSTSSLSGSASRTFTIAYVQPASPKATITLDDVTGTASITAVSGDAEGATVTTSYLSVSRIYDDETTVIATGITSSGAIIDRLIPVNVEITYRIYAWTSYGANSSTDYKVTLESGRAYLNYGDDYALVVNLYYEPSAGDDRSDDSQLFEAAGHEHYILGSGSIMYDTYKASGIIYGVDDVRKFQKVYKARTKPMYFRNQFGEVAKVHSEFSASNDSELLNKKYDVTMKAVE